MGKAIFKGRLFNAGYVKFGMLIRLPSRDVSRKLVIRMS